MAVTLVINPMFDQLNPKAFLGGQFADDTHIQVEWNNLYPSNDNAHEAMMNLDALMHAHPGTPTEPTNIIAWSAGSQHANKWMREKGPTSGLDPANYRFWLAGDPEQDYTGACYLYPDADTPKYPGDPAHGGTPHDANCPTPLEFHGGYHIGYGLPEPCPWRVDKIANEFDGWADSPDASWESNPQLNRYFDRLFGIIPRYVFSHDLLGCLMRASTGPHGDYETKGLDTPGTKSYTDPNNTTVTYHWIPTYPFVSLYKIAGIRWLVQHLDRKRRPVVNQSYDHRPVTMDDPNPSPAVTWFD